MPIVISNNFGVMGANQTLENFDSAWLKIAGAAYGLQGTATGTRRLRLGGPIPGGQATYRNVTPITPDLEIQYSVHFFGALSSRNVTMRYRIDPTFSKNYTLDFSGTGITLYRVAGSVTVAGTHSFTPALGATYSLRIRTVGPTIQIYLNGGLVIAFTDPDPLTGYSAVELNIQTVIGAGQSPTDGNSVQVGFFQLETLGGVPEVMELNPAAVKSEFKTRLPTWTAGGKLNPAAAKSEFRTAAVTLIKETVYLEFTTPYAQFVAAMPELVGGATTFDAPTAYSQFVVADVMLQSGQALSPLAARAEFRVAETLLEPGPVERTPTPVFSRWGVASVSIAMGLIITADSVASIWRTRKPTLKTRFTCGALAPLQDRLGARVSQDGGSSCNVGVRGSDGLVKW